MYSAATASLSVPLSGGGGSDVIVDDDDVDPSSPAIDDDAIVARGRRERLGVVVRKSPVPSRFLGPFWRSGGFWRVGFGTVPTAEAEDRDWLAVREG